MRRQGDVPGSRWWVLTAVLVPGLGAAVPDPITSLAVADPPGVAIAVAQSQLTAEQRAVYIGTYDLGRIRFRVFERDDYLVGRPTGQRGLPLVYDGRNRFHPDIPDTDIFIEFHVVDGRATSLTLHEGNEVTEGRRVE